MRRLFTLFVLLLLPLAAGATSVTATVTDPDASVWINATYTFQLVGNRAPYLSGGVTFPLTVSGTTNGSGVLSATVTGLDTITPTGASWELTICSQTSAPCQIIQGLPITGSSVDLSTNISSALIAPRFIGGVGTFGYADVEVQNLQFGMVYWNVTSNSCRQYTGTAWGSCSTGGGGAGLGTANTFTNTNTFTNSIISSGTNTFSGETDFLGSTNTYLSQSFQYSPIKAPASCSFTFAFNGTTSSHSGTSPMDCAWLAAAAQADSTGLHYTVDIPSAFTGQLKSTCMIEPDHGFVNLIGHDHNTSRGSKVVTLSGCTGDMIQYSSSASTVIGGSIRDITLDGGGISARAINMTSAFTNDVSHVQFQGFTTTDAWVKVTSSVQLDFHDNNFTGTNLNGLTVASVTCASNGSGVISGACTVSSGGSGYSATTNLVAFMSGAPTATTATPCTTMPTFTFGALSGGAVTTVTASGGSGCGISTTYFVLVFDMPPAAYAISTSATDYVDHNTMIDGVGRTAAVNVTGGDATYYSLHPYYVPQATVNTANLILYNPRYDSIFLHGSEINSSSGTIIDSPFITFTSNLGLTYPYWNMFLLDSGFANMKVSNILCSFVTSAPTGYYQFLTSGGVANNPSGVQMNGNQSCDTTLYTASDYTQNILSTSINLQPATPAAYPPTPSLTSVSSPQLTFAGGQFSGGNAYEYTYRLSVIGGSNLLDFREDAHPGAPNGYGIDFEDRTAATNSTVVPITLFLDGATWNGSASVVSELGMAYTPGATNSVPGKMAMSKFNQSRIDWDFNAGLTSSLAQVDEGTPSLSGCATISASTGGAMSGSFSTTTTGTCTLTITPGFTTPNHFVCGGSDTTTGHLATFIQNGTVSATTCQMQATTTSGDVITWWVRAN